MAAEVLSVLSGDAFTRVSQAHNDSVRDGAHFTVARNDMAAYKLYIEDPQYGSLGCDHVDFEGTVGRRYLRALLFGYAASLGLFDVRYVDSHVALDDYADFWGDRAADQTEPLRRFTGGAPDRAGQEGGGPALATETVPARENPCQGNT